MIAKLLATKLFPRNFIHTKFQIALPHSSKLFYCTEEPLARVELNAETILFLEKLSLVNFENQKYVTIVESAIEFANGISEINTNNVEPLVTVLEDRSLRLREDVVTDGNCKKEVLQNAALTEEDYFVAPPGNIPVNLQKLKE